MTHTGASVGRIERPVVVADGGAEGAEATVESEVEAEGGANVDDAEGGTGTPSTDDGGCCRTLIVKVERVTINDLTDGLGRDDVMITAASEGDEAVTPERMTWPKGTDVELDTGEFTQPREVVRVTPAANTCEFSLDSVVHIWEAGPKDLDKALRATVAELESSSAAGAASGWLLVPGIGAILHLFGTLFDNLIDLLDLDDTLMGRVEISCEDRLTADRPLKDYNWVFKRDEIEELSADVIRIKRTMRRAGGEWEVWIDITRICP